MISRGDFSSLARLAERVARCFCFPPVFPDPAGNAGLDARELAEWILADGLACG